MKNHYSFKELWKIFDLGKRFAVYYRKQFPEDNKVKSYCAFLIHSNWYWVCTLVIPLILMNLPILLESSFKPRALLMLGIGLGSWPLLIIIFFVVFKIKVPSDMLEFAESMKKHFE